MAISVIINGSRREIEPGLNVQDLLELLAINSGPVAVEVNSDIVPRSQHSSHRLQANDNIEIVQAIGGG